MSQSKKMSLIESISNIIIGYIVALASQKLIFPFFGIYIDNDKHIMIGLAFTCVSLVRSYLLRRLFNKKRRTL